MNKPGAKEVVKGPYIRFEETEDGSPLGTCPLCSDTGVVDSCCKKCSAYVWFKATKASIDGTCPVCKEKGVVDTLCVKCSEAAGLAVGTCKNCTEQGPEGDICEECDYEYEEVFLYGECQGCHGTGIVGNPCMYCEDQCLFFSNTHK
jgi:hypothetical protein